MSKPLAKDLIHLKNVILNLLMVHSIVCRKKKRSDTTKQCNQCTQTNQFTSIVTRTMKFKIRLVNNMTIFSFNNLHGNSFKLYTRNVQTLNNIQVFWTGNKIINHWIFLHRIAFFGTRFHALCYKKSDTVQLIINLVLARD